MLPCKLCLEQKFPIFQEDHIKENSIFKPLGGFVSPVDGQAHKVDRWIRSTHSVFSEEGVCVFWKHLAGDSLPVNPIEVFSKIQNC